MVASLPPANTKAFFQSYNVNPQFVSRYHPQANAADAANKTIGTAIETYVKTNNREPKIACALNTASHSSTKTSPYYSNFGCHMITEGNTPRGQIENNRSDESFQKIRDYVHKHLEKTHEVSKRRYDLRARPIEYAVGETVWRKTFFLSDASRGFAAKLAPKYIRCTVKKKLGFNSYELSDENGKALGIFSTKDMKKA